MFIECETAMYIFIIGPGTFLHLLPFGVDLYSLNMSLL